MALVPVWNVYAPEEIGLGLNKLVEAGYRQYLVLACSRSFACIKRKSGFM